jgi:hypothetical protein
MKGLLPCQPFTSVRLSSYRMLIRPIKKKILIINPKITTKKGLTLNRISKVSMPSSCLGNFLNAF